MANGFNPKRRTPAYLKAVVALRELEPGLRTCAYAEASADDCKGEWAQTAGLKKASGRDWWGRLIGLQPEPDRVYESLPRDDHVSLWTKDGKPAVYVSQPDNLGLGDLRGIVAACDRYGLDLSVSAGSWYFPGSTLMVEYRQAGKETPADSTAGHLRGV